MGFFKRSVTFEGMDCIADSETAAYMAAYNKLQAEIPWAYQAHYAKVSVYFGVVIIFIATLKHLWYRARDYSYKNSSKSGIIGSFIDVFVAYSRFVAYKQIPANVSYYTSLPPSFGTILVYFSSSFYALCYCLIPHFWYRGCRGFGSPPLAVRAGVMATALTPFIYVLSGKSNMLTLLTGISYEKLNGTHQYVGVLALVLSLIHTIPFIYQNLQEGGASNLYSVFTSQFAYYSGIPPLILLGILCIASKSFIRKYFYEAFLHVHWACGIAYFGTLIWHINNSLGMQDYMWGALAFWASQLIYRALVKTAFRPNSLFLRPREAELKRLGSGAYEVVVRNTKGLSWKAGQHCYLRFVGTRMLDNHPFSICTVPNEEESELRFIIVPKKGLTKKIFNELDDYLASKKRVYLDGPYGGTTRDPMAFEKIVLLATGSGVSATLPYLSELVNKIELNKKQDIDTVPREIDFVWIIRHIDDLNWIRDELTRCISELGNIINASVYVCEYSEEKKEKKEKNIVEKKSFDVDTENTLETPLMYNETHQMSITYGKPDISNILVSMRSTFKKRNMIVSSGSDSMKSLVSSTISNFQPMIFNSDLYPHSQNIEEIYLHTESFGW